MADSGACAVVAAGWACRGSYARKGGLRWFAMDLRGQVLRVALLLVSTGRDRLPPKDFR